MTHHGPANDGSKNEPATPRRIRRELATVRAMIVIYCRAHHHRDGDLCEECTDLLSYVQQRVLRCPFGSGKPTCLNCPIHCYKPERREQIRTVMRYSGPRMTWRHPVLTILHLLDGRRSASQRDERK
ncbi:MAG: nitrous oxide-stimulated promoter family protein [Bradymonadales bacterium]|nr:nitrous oxide-stimulated promoter family protein [Bradymonadales bacterium]